MIGRNEPCPCGSGRKYKKCCLEKDKAKDIARNRVKLAEGQFESIIQKVSEFSKEHDKGYRNKCEVDFGITNYELENVMNVYYLVNYKYNKQSSMMLDYLNKNKTNINKNDEEIIENILNSYMSVYQVKEKDINKILLRDIILNEDVYVEDIDLFTLYKEGEFLLARVVNIDGIKIFIDNTVKINEGKKTQIKNDIDNRYKQTKKKCKTKKQCLINNIKFMYQNLVTSRREYIVETPCSEDSNNIDGAVNKTLVHKNIKSVTPKSEKEKERELKLLMVRQREKEIAQKQNIKDEKAEKPIVQHGEKEIILEIEEPIEQKTRDKIKREIAMPLVELIKEETIEKQPIVQQAEREAIFEIQKQTADNNQQDVKANLSSSRKINDTSQKTKSKLTKEQRRKQKIEKQDNAKEIKEKLVSKQNIEDNKTKIAEVKGKPQELVVNKSQQEVKDNQEELVVSKPQQEVKDNQEELVVSKPQQEVKENQKELVVNKSQQEVKDKPKELVIKKPLYRSKAKELTVTKIDDKVKQGKLVMGEAQHEIVADIDAEGVVAIKSDLALKGAITQDTKPQHKDIENKKQEKVSKKQPTEQAEQLNNKEKEENIIVLKEKQRKQVMARKSRNPQGFRDRQRINKRLEAKLKQRIEVTKRLESMRLKLELIRKEKLIKERELKLRERELQLEKQLAEISSKSVSKNSENTVAKQIEGVVKNKDCNVEKKNNNSPNKIENIHIYKAEKIESKLENISMSKIEQQIESKIENNIVARLMVEEPPKENTLGEETKENKNPDKKTQEIITKKEIKKEPKQELKKGKQELKQDKLENKHDKDKKKIKKNENKKTQERCKIYDLLLSKVENQYKQKCIEEWKKFRQIHKSYKGSENGWAAAIEYEVRKNSDDTVTQGQISKKYDISAKTLSKRYKELKIS